jgi:hypothetical protein
MVSAMAERFARGLSNLVRAIDPFSKDPATVTATG